MLIYIFEEFMKNNIEKIYLILYEIYIFMHKHDGLHVIFKSI